MGIFKAIDTFILGFQCREFWENFPKDDKPGPWIATAIRLTPFSEREVRWAEVKGGLRDAYLVARRLALHVDRETPTGLLGSREAEVGIGWGIRRKRAGE